MVQVYFTQVSKYICVANILSELSPLQTFMIWGAFIGTSTAKELNFALDLVNLQSFQLIAVEF